MKIEIKTCSDGFCLSRVQETSNDTTSDFNKGISASFAVHNRQFSVVK